MNRQHTAKLTLVLRRFLGEDVALERLSALDAARAAHFKALRCSALGFHLRHDGLTFLLEWPGGVVRRTFGHALQTFIGFSRTTARQYSKPAVIAGLKLCFQSKKCPQRTFGADLCGIRELRTPKSAPKVQTGVFHIKNERKPEGGARFSTLVQKQLLLCDCRGLLWGWCCHRRF